MRKWPDLPELARLRSLAWGGTEGWSGVEGWSGTQDGTRWAAVLERSLTWVTAHDTDTLVGFVNVAWDGGVHAFLLDTTVHPDWQRRGVGVGLVRRAAQAAREHRGVEWLHVDYEPYLTDFYAACGFTPTPAGLLRLAP